MAMEKGSLKRKKTKTGHICSHATPKPVQILCVLMSALSRHSILCVYHASLLLEIILMGEVQANIEDNLVQQMFQALFVILCPLWKVKIIFLSGL